MNRVESRSAASNLIAVVLHVQILDEVLVAGALEDGSGHSWKLPSLHNNETTQNVKTHTQAISAIC